MEALGINPVLLTAQLISFLALLAVLNKFLYKKLRRSLQERREMVAATLKQKEEIDKKLAGLEEERQILKKQNQSEMKTLLAESQASAESLKKETLAQTEARAKKILEQAQEQIEQNNLKAQEELKSQAKILAREMAQQVLQEQKKNNNFSKLNIDRSISELKNL